MQVIAPIALDARSSAHLQIDLYVYSRNLLAQFAFALKEDMVVPGVSTHTFRYCYESSRIGSRGYIAYVSGNYVKSIIGTRLVGKRSDRLHSTGHCELLEDIVASCQAECADVEFLDIFEIFPKTRTLLQLPDIGTSVLESTHPVLTEQLAHSLLCDKEPAQDCKMLFREIFQHSLKKPWKTCDGLHSWVKKKKGVSIPSQVKSRLMSYLRM